MIANSQLANSIHLKLKPNLVDLYSEIYLRRDAVHRFDSPGQASRILSVRGQSLQRLRYTHCSIHTLF